jgi:hypothetical protein
MSFICSKKKCSEKDAEFLKGQGLSESQISSISIYYGQRLSSRTACLIFSFIAILAIAGTVGYTKVNEYVENSTKELKEKDSKMLCIQNPFLPPER